MTDTNLSGSGEGYGPVSYEGYPNVSFTLEIYSEIEDVDSQGDGETPIERFEEIINETEEEPEVNETEEVEEEVPVEIPVEEEPVEETPVEETTEPQEEPEEVKGCSNCHCEDDCMIRDIREVETCTAMDRPKEVES